ncbi:MAG: metallophosphoesterase [Candidatus Latescibacteria bacterium]|nr:metallophosphoesterase [bacterium]MBD3425211.1 metallophosphoesterase [Candidatus Latescibacterota bacterium]
MRYAILSDIHANIEALEAVLEDMRSLRIDRLLHLGDIINYGPDPAHCLERVIELGIDGVTGNHERALLSRASAGNLNITAYDSLSATREMLAEEQLDHLANLPVTRVVDGMLLVHGCPPDSVSEYISHHDYRSRIYGLDEVFMKMEQSIAFVGHTHLLGLYTQDEEFKTDLHYGERLKLDQDLIHIVNVGSVGQPRDGNTHARYVIYDSAGMSIEPRYVSYPVTITVEKIYRSEMPDLNGERLISGY